MKTYKCIKCGAVIKEFDDVHDVDSDTDRMWEGGVVFKIISGFGSQHDGGMFTGALCDKCIDIMTQIGTLNYLGDYIYGDSDYIPLQ